MTVLPAIYNLVIPQRASLRETFRIPYDGTNAEVYASMWDSDKRRKQLLSFSIEWIDRYEEWDPDDPSKVRSTIIMTATWEQTRLITKNGYWDLLWVWPDETRDYLLEGSTIINKNVTEEPIIA